MTKEQENKLEQIFDFYGRENQFCILQEECAELIQAISKYRRNNDDFSYRNFIEELADVSIMIQQFLVKTRKSKRFQDEFQGFINEKIERQLQRMKN